MTGTAIPPTRWRSRPGVGNWLAWAVLLVVLVASLVIGAQRSSHPSLDQRTLQIAGVVRCPVCAGQSAAQSDAPPSVEIRALIHQKLAAGETESHILDDLVASYGASILEQPQAHGVSLVVWLLPVAGFVVAVAGLALAFGRWRTRIAVPVSVDDRALVERALLADDAGREEEGSTDGGRQ